MQLHDSPKNRKLGKRQFRTFLWLASAVSPRQISRFFVQPKNVVFKDGVPIKVIGHKTTGDGTSWESTSVNVVNPVWLDLMYIQDLKRHR